MAAQWQEEDDGGLPETAGLWATPAAGCLTAVGRTRCPVVASSSHQAILPLARG